MAHNLYIFTMTRSNFTSVCISRNLVRKDWSINVRNETQYLVLMEKLYTALWQLSQNFILMILFLVTAKVTTLEGQLFFFALQWLKICIALWYMCFSCFNAILPQAWSYFAISKICREMTYDHIMNYVRELEVIWGRCDLN